MENLLYFEAIAEFTKCKIMINGFEYSQFHIVKQLLKTAEHKVVFCGMHILVLNSTPEVVKDVNINCFLKIGERAKLIKESQKNVQI